MIGQSYLRELKKILIDNEDAEKRFYWKLNLTNKKPELIFTARKIILAYSQYA